VTTGHCHQEEAEGAYQLEKSSYARDSNRCREGEERQIRSLLGVTGRAVSPVTAMRRVLASVLTSAAKLFLLIDNAEEHDQLLRETASLRDRLAKNVSSLRTMSEVVEYEFGDDREQHIRSSELILQISITAAALIWNQVAVLHDEQGLDFLAEPGLVEMRRRLADRLNVLAEAVVRKTSWSEEHLGSFVSRHLLGSEHYGEYVRNTIARYEDLQTPASQLGGEI
jgi:multidrug resistance protein MdtO